MSRRKNRTSRRSTKSRNRSGQKTLGLGEWGRAWMNDSTGERHTVAQPYSQCVWVADCIDRIASAIASMPVKVTDVNDKEIESGPLVDLVRRPNPKMRWKKFISETVGHYLLGGETDWLTAEWAGSKPRAILPVGKNSLTPIKSGNSVAVWELNAGGEKRIFLLDEVVQVKRWNPYGIRGLSKLEAAQLSLNQNHKAEQFNNFLLDNDMAIGGLLTAPEITEEQQKQILATLRRRNAGPENAGKPLIMTGGLTWVDSVRDMSKMQHVELSKMSREGIAAAFDTPLPILGIMESAQLDNMRATRKIWLEGALMPLADSLSEEFTEAYAQKFGDYYVWINWQAHPIYQEILQESIDAGKKLFDMMVPFDDVNKWMNWGLPERPWHKIGWRTSSLVQWDESFDLGEEIPEPGSEEELATNDTNPTNETEGGKSVKGAKGAKSPEAGGLDADVIEIVKTQVWNRWKQSWTKLEKKFAGAMGKYFYFQRKRILERLETLELGEKSIAKAAMPVDEILKILFNTSEENQKLVATVKPLISEAAAFGASQAGNEIGLEGVFGVDDPLPIKIMRQRIPKLVKINKFTRQRVGKAVAEGLKNGETAAQIAQRVKKDFGFSGARSMNIARTETAGAVSQGRHEGFKKAGVPSKSWLSSRGGAVRPTHQTADARYTKNPIPVGKRFEVGNGKLMHPGDPSGPVEEIVNCACCELPVMAKQNKTVTLSHYANYAFMNYETWTVKAHAAA